MDYHVPDAMCANTVKLNLYQYSRIPRYSGFPINHLRGYNRTVFPSVKSSTHLTASCSAMAAVHVRVCYNTEILRFARDDRSHSPLHHYSTTPLHHPPELSFSDLTKGEKYNGTFPKIPCSLCAAVVVHFSAKGEIIFIDI
jgi:hypothetical protein